MKYPNISVPKLPAGFKHCSVAIALHFELKNKESFSQGDDADTKVAYLDFIEKEMGSVMDSLLTIYRPDVTKCDDRYIIVMKDNADINRVMHMSKQLLKEVDRLTSGTMQFSFYILDCIITQLNLTPTFLKANKIGNDIFASEEFKQAKVDYDPAEKVEEMSVLTSYPEFKIKK